MKGSKVIATKRNRQFFIIGIGLMFLLATGALHSQELTIPYVFTPGNVISSAEMNQNFSQVADKINSVQGQVDSLVSGGASLWNMSAGFYYYDGGEVGIGTSTPSSLLHVYSASGDVGIRVESANVSYNPYITLGYAGDADVRVWRDVSDHSLRFNTGGGTQMTITSAGNVGIGTTTPNGSLHIKDSTNINLGSNFDDKNAPLFITQDDNTGILIDSNQIEQSAEGNSLYLNYTSSAEVVIAYGGGNVGIGTTLPSYKLDVTGDVRCTGSTSQWSDLRYKTDIVTIPNALERLGMLRGINFTWIDQERFGEGLQMGIIAQEIEEVFPETVHTDAEGNKSVTYSKLTAVLIESVKELKAQNDYLLARIEEMEKN